MTPNPEIDHLIVLYLSNRASDFQKQELEQWINASEANKEIFEHIKNIWTKPSEVRISRKMMEKRDAIWAAGTERGQLKESAPPRIIDISYWSKIAATFLVVLLSSWIVYKISSPSAETATVAFIQKQNPAGQKSMHILPDGTQVWLNAESSLIYPEQFSDTLRLVKLTGEGFFEVVHNKNRPFIVESGGTNTEVLGTSFNIQAYPENEIVKISLLEGKVRVQDMLKSHTSFLSPGQELFIPKDRDEFTIRPFNYEKAFGWKEGILIFDGVDFETFWSIVEKWYGVKVEVKGAPHAEWNIRARYVNENLKFVLRDISFNKDFKFELNDKQLVIIF